MEPTQPSLKLQQRRTSGFSGISSSSVYSSASAVNSTSDHFLDSLTASSLNQAEVLKVTPHTKRKRRPESQQRLSCWDKLFPCWVSPVRLFHYHSSCVQGSLKSLEQVWRPLLDVFCWPKLPLNKHEKAMNKNYLAHKLWILTLSAGRCYSAEDYKEDMYKGLYEDVAKSVEMCGRQLKLFTEPIARFSNTYEYFDKMGQYLNVDTKMKDDELMNETNYLYDENILDCNKYSRAAYSKIKVYIRNTKSVEWDAFEFLDFSKKISLIQEGTKEIKADVNSILATLPKVLQKYKEMDNPTSKRKSYIPHLRKMENLLRTIIATKVLSTVDETYLKKVLEKTSDAIIEIIHQSSRLATSIWELLVVSRSCYAYLQGGPGSEGFMLSYEEILSKLSENLDKDAAHQLVPYEYIEWSKFYRLDVVDTLRKVPVFVQNHTELALHLEGHVNSSKKSSLSSLASLANRSKSKRKSNSMDKSILRKIKFDATALQSYTYSQKRNTRANSVLKKSKST